MSKQAKIVPMILAGGSGTRLWPVSRQSMPKQFTTLPGFEKSLFVLTLDRVKGDLFTDPVIVCHEDHRLMVQKIMKDEGFNDARIIVENDGRNTAPAIATGVLMSGYDQKSCFCVLPADHVINEADVFQRDLANIAKTMDKSDIVTLGIKPTKPATGYGYIEAASPVQKDAVVAIKQFIEKPAANLAKELLKKGGVYWNGGMFMFRGDAYLKEMQKYAPIMLQACKKAIKEGNFDSFFRYVGESYKNVPSDSIDYAVMEHTKNAKVYEANFTWSDVGSWDAVLENIQSQSGKDSCVIGDVNAIDVENSLIAANSKLVCAIGVKDMVIIENDDVVLVMHKDKAQKIKNIVEKLKLDDREEMKQHAKVLKPWGTFQTIDFDQGFRVKEIVVNPGEKLSLQMHYHRAEHWIVVKGTAQVEVDEASNILYENQSVFIPKGAHHRLENPGKVPLKLIEIQYGEYLGEDDIVRFEDIYGRDDSVVKAQNDSQL